MAKNHELAFSTFLKLLELDEQKKRTMLRGFLRGGGYNYWRPLQVLAPDVARGDLGMAGIQEKCGAMSKSHQRKYNEAALTKLLKWTSRRSVTVRAKPDTPVTRKFGNAGLKVRIQPELIFCVGSQRYWLQMWATNSPTLTEETFSMGLFFLINHARQEHRDSDLSFLIFDTIKEKMYGEFDVLANAQHHLSAQRAIIDGLWSELTSSSVGDEDRDWQEDQPSPLPS